MQPQPPKKKSANLNLDVLFGFIVIGAVAVLLLMTSFPWPVGVGVIFLFLVLVWFGRDHDVKAYRDHRMSRSVTETKRQQRRAARRNRERERHARMLDAQLRKPDFESRLQSFTSSVNVPETDESLVSKMKFWQLNDASTYGKTPSRPVEILRLLLQRISKLVGQSK